MADMTIDDLQRIAGEVIGDREVAISRHLAASAVPGWDSLAHTLIVLEIAAEFDIAIDAAETAGLPDLGALIDFANARIGGRNGGC